MYSVARKNVAGVCFCLQPYRPVLRGMLMLKHLGYSSLWEARKFLYAELLNLAEILQPKCKYYHY